MTSMPENRPPVHTAARRSHCWFASAHASCPAVLNLAGQVSGWCRLLVGGDHHAAVAGGGGQDFKELDRHARWDASSPAPCINILNWRWHA